jgi:gamma-glutamylcyclotransferase (GGCT)/AIG2-like uncharacterized protein YtfP
MRLLFVYGTLKTGFKNHHILTRDGDTRFLWDDQIAGFLWRTPTALPMATQLKHPAMWYRDRGDEIPIVHGQVWLGPDELIARLDTFEGHPNWYERRSVRGLVSCKSVEVYFMPTSGVPHVSRLISEGVWKHEHEK